MKKLFTSSFLLLTTLSTTLYGYPPGFNADVGVGYRQDQLKWATRDPQDSTDPVSSLKWKELQIFDINGFANFTTCNYWYFRVNGNYGRIYSGRVDDSDYSVSASGGSSRTLIEKNHLNGGRGEVFDLGGGVGYVFKSAGGRMTIAPLIGYMHSEQHLRAYDAVNVFLFDSTPLGRIEGANSTYNNRWYGGFAAYDMVVNFSCNLRFIGTVQGMMGNYRAKANWNLRDDIIGDVFHKGNFVGGYGQGGFIYNIFCNHFIGVTGTYRNLWTHHGEQKITRVTYFVNAFGIATGESIVKSKQKMHVRWTSWSVLGNWLWHF